ncbi:hypothetical protein [Aquabacterium humicola]|uniref:hypothetical protein n=1 Tax=Aquabacterium humicola TaxID=3237377 RepID=UPI0025427D8D|nr:hypothetical protein [Rubrivivax pictus]
MSKTPQLQLTPKDFKVNQAWLAYKANRKPLPTDKGDVDVFILQDAGSLFIFGNAFTPVGAESPNPRDAAVLLQEAWSRKQEWPSELLLPGAQSEDNGFARAASWNGISVRFLPAECLSYFIEDVQSSYEEFLNRGD